MCVSGVIGNLVYIQCRLLLHAHTQPFYSSMDFVWDNPGELVPEEETFTHSHLSWSLIVPCLLLPSNITMALNRRLPRSRKFYLMPCLVLGSAASALPRLAKLLNCLVLASVSSFLPSALPHPQTNCLMYITASGLGEGAHNLTAFSRSMTATVNLPKIPNKQWKKCVLIVECMI